MLSEKIAVLKVFVRAYHRFGKVKARFCALCLHTVPPFSLPISFKVPLVPLDTPLVMTIIVPPCCWMVGAG